MPRFCSECGAELPSRPPVTCASCGTAHWRNAKPAAAALVARAGTLLLVRRAHDPWRGAWSAPSGFCDGLEHPIDAAEREAREETGVAVRVTGYLGTWTDTYADRGAEEDAELISVAYYFAEPVDERRASFDPVEVSEVRWFANSEFPSDLAPPRTLPHVLRAWRAAYEAGETVTALRDRGSLPARG